ncbi:PstS family phosphate ABC transporter substrate-binding protein [Hephaestia sp. GCM10023244]|uniref:PstS family phosphate ABC transporter substrate-binding protein n=1 Tax=unclassified Hephaestia TaxID=2631281 RepID=UPI0020775FB0|nr:PstS family phosphate ABC transporter substrate-binding protein [Hephaestia sp. MAHUQ-44]MCM8730295.1 PstS family phosphate ABC transporter substrate-binding protein [Hephaestia sp. MAHUQ-44]
MLRSFALLAVSALALSACTDQAASGGGGARDQIRVVGSSTVYPFTQLVAEQFVNNNPGMKAPVIESTGTGGGMKLFCAGVGAQHPDIVNASRRLKASEYADCKANGAADVLEIQVGIDGIAFAEAKNGPRITLTTGDIYKALAANPGGKPNATKTWKDVNPALPAIPIQVYGPPSTSGTRDALAELILAKGCKETDPQAKALDSDAFDKRCKAVREDGAYVDAGENDNLIVQKLQANPNAIGIFGYSYLEENTNKLEGAPIDGVAPTYDTIAGGSYPGARPLYIYVKKAHLDAIPGLRQFLAEYATAWTKDGPLVKRGLIAAPDSVLAHSAEVIKNATPLDPSELH